MAKRFDSQQEIDTFLETPRLAILLYKGSRPAPTGVPVWFDWDGKTVRMFASRTSPKVAQLTKNRNISVLVTNQVGEPRSLGSFRRQGRNFGLCCRRLERSARPGRTEILGSVECHLRERDRKLALRA